ncbi:MAG: CoB--CoM heterodisulfide reductase iron-sulfur subunit B family protein [Candidatus Helarchaeota archaeon]
MEYKLFLGCVIPARLPFIETASRKVFEKLDINLIDIKGYSCCPDPTGLAEIDMTSYLALGARNLCIANKDGGEIMSLCSGCVETLKTVNHILTEDYKKRKIINEIIKKVGLNFEKSVTIKHFAQVIYENLDKVEKEIVNPLKGFKVACHYGCHFMRPSHIINWDDPFEPSTIDEIIKVLGGESIDYEFKMECCGYPVEKTDENLSEKMLQVKLDSISKSNANCITVVCPACYIQYDFKQRKLSQSTGNSYNFPVFYLSELLALALGYNKDEIGLKFHSTKVNSLLEQVGFEESK